MRPLVGKRILDLSRYAPGPYCSLVCASLGAEVVKIEAPPDGDPMRAIDAAAFEWLNRGKKSLVVDLKTAAGAASLRRLLPTTDVLIESFRPGVMTRLGLDYPSVQNSAPGIVYVSLSGYGQSGPLSGRAGHDINYMASAGGLDGVEQPLPIQVADFASGGLYAVIAILAALLDGVGRYVDLSLFEGVLSLSMAGDGRARDLLSGRYANYSVYATKDGGALSVGALEQKFWNVFCRVIERPELAERRDDPGVRALVAEVIASRSREHWEERFRDTDACVELVRTPAEAVSHPQARHRGYAHDVFRLPFGSPAELDEPARAPALGEHTEEILGPLG